MRRGAGGGSIAYVPELTKALRVGPQSAGAAPGPAAYGKGGEKPTVTDANVVLGYLPASTRLGGDMKIDRALAERAVIPGVVVVLGAERVDEAIALLDEVEGVAVDLLRRVVVTTRAGDAAWAYHHPHPVHGLVAIRSWAEVPRDAEH